MYVHVCTLKQTDTLCTFVLLSSFRMFCNYVVQVQIVQLDEERGEFVLKSTFDHPYPTTKIMWIPDQVCVMCVCTHSTPHTPHSRWAVSQT